MTLKDAYSTQELKEVLGMDAHTSVTRRATRENWQSQPRVGRGGGREWLVASMPEATRLELSARLVSKLPAPITAQQQVGLAEAGSLRPGAKARAAARVSVLLLARVFTVNSGKPRIPAVDAFVALWNAGEIEADPDVRAVLPRLCRNSLLNWQKKAENNGVAALGGRYGEHLRGKGCIDGQPEVRESILGMLGEHPDCSAQLVHEALLTMNRERTTKQNLPALRLPSLRRVQEWMQQWKRDNAQVFGFVRAPDNWRNQFMLSCGEAYELITRYNQRWEYDGTPADILLADGKRYTIVGVINVYSRELKLEVALHSSAMVVANLTRRALLDWGVPEEAVTDNGKEFTATHMQQVILALDIFPNILPPFRPDLKPAIERVFRTFSHHLLTLEKGYVGHNVAARQAIRERETFAKRLFSKGETVEIAMTPEALQTFCDNWTDKVYRHKKHGGLHGKTPFEMRQSWAGEVCRVEDERALDVLLIPLASNNGWRTVGKKGVGVGRGRFMHTALGVMVGSRVQVRTDRADPFNAYIFNEDGEFVCKAVRMNALTQEERRSLSVNARREQKAFVSAGAKILRGMAKATDAEHAAERIMQYHIERADEIEAAAVEHVVDVVPYSTATLEQCGVASRAKDNKAPQVHGEAVQAARESARQQLAAKMQHWLPEGDMGKVRLYQRLREAEIKSASIPSDQVAWMREFEKTQLYVGFAMTYGWTLPGSTVELRRAVGQ